MPRGGPRQGAPGTSYGNRTDLNSPRALPVTVGPSQQYGQAAALSQLQKAVPTANAPLPTPPPLATAPGASDPTAPQPGSVGGQPPSGPPAPLPGELGDFGGPSQNPGEHVMTGVPSGPGPGPEVLPPNSGSVPARFNSVRDLVQSLAQTNPSPALATLAMYSGNSL